MAVLITGAVLVGCHTARALAERGERPVLFDVAPSSAYVDRVVGLERVTGMTGRFYAGIQLNILGTTNVLEAARLQAIHRVVFCSSQAVHDTTVSTDGPLREDRPLRPHSLYATTKLAGEYLGLQYAVLAGFEFIALRLAPVFGPGKWAGGSVGGRFIRQVMDRAVRGAAAACRAPALPASTYNVGSGELHDLDDALAVVARLVPTSRGMTCPSAWGSA